jgi:mono/diheme cytochrome c family protein
MSAFGYALALLFVLATAQTDAHAQNLDQNKSGAKLFAATCADCHRSARGLAKGRMSLLLSLYLREHYTSSFSSAQTITAYLQSVDTPPRGKSPSRARKSPATTTSAAASPSALRPPATVPGR